VTGRRIASLAILLVPCAVFLVAFVFSRLFSPSTTFTAKAAPISSTVTPSRPQALIAPALPRVHTPLPKPPPPRKKHKAPPVPTAAVTTTTPAAGAAATQTPAVTPSVPSTPTPTPVPTPAPVARPAPKPTPKPTPTPTFDNSG
jgi:outer membrane biosynthesis protein TonB